MALVYDLILIGDNSVEQVAERALPNPDERPTGTPPLLRSADLHERYGFNVSVLSRDIGYVAAESDNGMWEFEPDAHIAVTFYLDKSAELDWSITNMLTVIRRLLDSGDEDALLILDGDFLLLTRFGGTLTKHRRATWWDHFPTADETITG
ncbi:SitI3 family protein [Actinoplanes sp. NPDC026670]|uniref:SitI3 family protein n=1 Tax=Actinoplanes sp. NPDC026670 TaxID=3154700 RepID=UPI0033DF9468